MLHSLTLNRCDDFFKQVIQKLHFQTANTWTLGGYIVVPCIDELLDKQRLCISFGSLYFASHLHVVDCCCNASAGMQGVQKAGLISLGRCITRACTQSHMRMHIQVEGATK